MSAMIAAGIILGLMIAAGVVRLDDPDEGEEW